MKKHIVCFGDSNTHGYCADPKDCADHTDRFNEEERWPCRLQKLLGEKYLVLEEGLSGRTTVFEDPLHESMPGISVIYSALMSHEPVDLLIIMLGTNDTKERFAANAACIGAGLERLATKAEAVNAWRGGKPNILVIAPPHIGQGHNDAIMGRLCHEKSMELAGYYRAHCTSHGWAFLDAQGIAEFNRMDFMHLTRKGHAQLAEKLAALLPGLMGSND